MTSPLPAIFIFVDENKDQFINNLSDVVAIPSVSASPEYRDDVLTMVHWMEAELRKVGADVELCDLGMQTLADGNKINLPPVILATLGKDPRKKTICIYGHLDVQPATKTEGWFSEPFKLSERGGKLYGRGASDDKGPVLGWLHAIQAYLGTNATVPVNIKGMEESGSKGLEELLLERRDSFLHGIDYVCISDNYWLGTDKPCLTYGLRGLCAFYIEVECTHKDLHSGCFGGSVYEAIADVIYLLNTLVDNKGNILIPGISDDILPLTPEEEEIYKTIEFSVDDYKKGIGAHRLCPNEDKSKVLMSRWRYPSLSIHGLEGAYSDQGFKTVIPHKVIGKFSIRIVPNQEPENVAKYVINHLLKKWVERNSPNNYKAYMVSSTKPWMTDPTHAHFTAAAKATALVYNMEPDLTREGGSIPITITLQEMTGKNVLLLPLGSCDDGAHSQNEKIDIRNFIEGTKLLAAYLYEVSLLK